LSFTGREVREESADLVGLLRAHPWRSSDQGIEPPVKLGVFVRGLKITARGFDPFRVGLLVSEHTKSGAGGELCGCGHEPNPLS
jgi:hypothetical protein